MRKTLTTILMATGLAFSGCSKEKDPFVNAKNLAGVSLERSLQTVTSQDFYSASPFADLNKDGIADKVIIDGDTLYFLEGYVPLDADDPGFHYFNIGKIPSGATAQPRVTKDTILIPYGKTIGSYTISGIKDESEKNSQLDSSDY